MNIEQQIVEGAILDELDKEICKYDFAKKHWLQKFGLMKNYKYKINTHRNYYIEDPGWQSGEPSYPGLWVESEKHHLLFEIRNNAIAEVYSSYISVSLSNPDCFKIILKWITTIINNGKPN